MKSIPGILTLGIFGICAIAAQSSAQAGKTGAQTSSGASASATASASAGNNSAELSFGTKINATLATTLDAKKNKPGDRVEARIAQDVKQDGRIVLKKGATLVGHVIQSQARTKDQSQSLLVIIFDRAVVKNIPEIPLSATIQALAAAQSSLSTDTSSNDINASGQSALGASGASSSGGALSEGATLGGLDVGGVVNTAARTTGGQLDSSVRTSANVGGLTSGGELNPNSRGVFGLQGLALASSTSSQVQGTAIVSPSQNVHLDTGTQILLSATTGQAQ
jgi:hypothetical protein